MQMSLLLLPYIINDGTLPSYVALSTNSRYEKNIHVYDNTKIIGWFWFICLSANTSLVSMAQTLDWFLPLGLYSPSGLRSALCRVRRGANWGENQSSTNIPSDFISVEFTCDTCTWYAVNTTGKLASLEEHAPKRSTAQSPLSLIGTFQRVIGSW